mgnify:CR=1 FL=1
MTKHLHISSADEKTFIVTGKTSYAFLTTLPERKPTSVYAQFLSPATDVTVEICKANADVITFEDEFTDTLFKSIDMRTILSNRVRQQTAAYKDSKVVPVKAYDLSHDERSSEYQLVAAYNSTLSDGYGLFMEQGTGKTLAAIIAACALPYGSRVIIIAPNNVRLNWVKEFKKFATVSTKVTVLRGGPLQRIDGLTSTFKDTGHHLSVAITGYDSLAGISDAISITMWDLAILDESHYVRNERTKRWRYIKPLRDVSKRRLVLTGTPIANSINDLYTQLEFMGDGYSGFSTFKGFKQFFGVYDRNEDANFERFLGMQNVPIIKDRLSRYSFTVTKAEVLPDLPDKVYNILECEMSPQQEQAYNRLAADLAFEIESKVANQSESNQALVINNVLTMLLKLTQITSGFLKIPAEIVDGEELHKEALVEFEPNAKLELLIEHLKEIFASSPTSKVIVWACYVYDIIKIQQRCLDEGIDAVTFYGGTDEQARIDAEARFNCDVKCKVFVGNPGSGGTGLNLLGYPPGMPDLLDTNADHVIYYSQDWSPLKRSQSEDRAHRRGTRNPINITDLVVPDTIDEAIRERVVEKRIRAFEIADVRALLREIMNHE